jgi:hypothetical protein
MDHESTIGVIWVLTYGALVLLVGGYMTGVGASPTYIVLILMVVLPFVASISGVVWNRVSGKGPS